MLTLFAVPKAFRGHTGLIQRNAIGSWGRLGGDSRVVLFGDEDGTAAVAREFNLDHVPEIARNEFGTPLVNSLFEAVAELVPDGELCYVNSDVILLDDFLPAIDRVRLRTNDFLVVGECWNLDLRTPVPFDDPSWQAEIRHDVSESATRRGRWFIDYFAFSHDLYQQLPPFAVGRAGFDNWLVWKACDLGATVVDATRVVTAVHQRHDYAHVRGGREWSYEGPEAVRNRELAGGSEHLYTIDHAGHLLTSRRIHRRPIWLHRPRWIRSSLAVTRPVRHRLGLRASTLQRLRKRVEPLGGRRR